MSETNIFERAAKTKLRFPSQVGDLTVEQLWDLPLTGRSANLNSIAVATSREIRELTEDSFVTEAPNPRKAALELRLEVLKHVIADKQAAAARATKRAENADRRRRILEAIAQKQDQALLSKSLDELLSDLGKTEAED
jgi:hypothetical protein